MDKLQDYIFKIILIGDSGVGKTSLMTRFTDKEYHESLSSTIGVDFKIKTIHLGNVKVKLQIWDTAGQERFRAVVSNYYRGANGIFVVFDLLNKNSFTHLKDWFSELNKKNAIETSEIMILGNKVDEKERSVSKEEIEEFLIENNIPLAHYSEVSAKDGISVDESFVDLTKRLITRFGSTKIKQQSKGSLGMNHSRRRCC
jgi:Ras-related protein Rab-1A